jgi:RNA polymerase sigma-70 factor (ECF subfamily)
MSIELTPDTIASFRKGDETAFSDIYELFNSCIYLYCRRKLAVEDAEDATAETFATLWREREKMAGIKHINNFLYLVAKQKVIAIKKKNSVKGVCLSESEIPDKAEEPINFAENQFLLTMLITEIRDIVDCLSPQCRQVFQYHLADKSAAEIGALMGINRSTVYNHYQTAKEKIRAALKKHGFSLTAAG